MHQGGILHRLFWSHQNQIIVWEYQWAKVFSKVNLFTTRDKWRHPRMPWTLGTHQASIRRNRRSTRWWLPLPPPMRRPSCRNPPSPKQQQPIDPNPEGVVILALHPLHSRQRESSHKWVSLSHTEMRRRSWRCLVVILIHTGSSNNSVRLPLLPRLSLPEQCLIILCKIRYCITRSNRRVHLRIHLNLYLEAKGLQGE